MNRTPRRIPIRRARTLPVLAMAALLAPLASGAAGRIDKFRVVWREDPAHRAVIGWCGGSADGATVHYGFEDFGQDWEKYPSSAGVGNHTEHVGLQHRFARLDDLQPDRKVFFVVRDGAEVSRRFWFLTAPAGEQPFTFVAGGDSRNHIDARRRANRTVACLRPLFVCFGGDMVSKPDPQTWSGWLDDWQLTTGDDGRMIPIVPARGNHEGKYCIHRTFDTLQPDDYSAFDIGRGYVRVYTLNSNITRAGAQGAWLAGDLATHAATRWKIAQYHHPFRPHTAGKKDQFEQYKAWAAPFYQFGVSLAIECDSHTVKRTWPVRPSTEPGSDEGFIRDDRSGTVFIGEGCWGAPLRPNDDDKDWTRDSACFNQVSWIAVTPERIVCRTVQVDHVDEFGTVDDAAPDRAPEGLRLWTPENGAEVVIHPRVADSAARLVTTRVRIVCGPTTGGTAQVRLVAIGGDDAGEAARIRFTTDGTEPTSSSPEFSGPFEAAAGTTIKAAAFEHGNMLSHVVSVVVAE